jgi:DNA-directed RNA polymerase specialized sigma subunit
MNQREVAEALGITRVAVQHIEKRAVAKFKKELAKRLVALQDLL